MVHSQSLEKMVFSEFRVNGQVVSEFSHGQ